MDTYSFQHATTYWRQVPAATFKIDSAALHQQASHEVLAVWEKGLQDYLNGWERRGFLPLIDRYVRWFRNARLLEIGCGLGFEHIHFFSPVVQESYLVDIVPSNVAVVDEVLAAKGMRQSRACLLEYDKKDNFPEVDFLYSHGVLHHIPFEICQNIIQTRFSPWLKTKGKFIVMLYTQKLYDDLKAISLEDFAQKTENPVPGFYNPWSEPYDAKKVEGLFGEAYCLTETLVFNRGYFAMYELEKR